MKHKKNPVSEIVVLSNPHRRHRRKHHVRRRRNPSISGIFSGVVPMLKEGALGAVGGIANDVAFGFAKKFLPDALQSGWGRTGAKLGFAALVGFIAGKVLPGKGRALAVGAATVTLHEAATSLMNSQLPSIPLGAYEDSLLGYDSASIVGPSMGAYMRNGVGAYMARPPQARNEGTGDLLAP